MSRGDLQEMEVGTKQSNTAVNAGAGKGDPMPSTPSDYVKSSQAVEDLGGPTPQNSKPDDESNALKTPTKTIKQVADVVTNRPGKGGGNPGMPTINKGKVSYEETETVEDEKVEAIVEDETVTKEDETKVDLNSAIEEDVNALLSGEDLSEEFKEKAKVIFEASINAKITDIENQLNEEYAAKLNEEVETIKVSLTERTDAYLEYVAEEWLEENQLAVERGIKAEMTESFLDGMKKLFEDKYDVLENMVDKLDEMETKLNEQIEKNVDLRQMLGKSTAQTVFNTVAEGLAVSQKEKLQSLAEGVEFESEESYRGKLETLKESYFKGGKTSSPASAPQELKEEAEHVETATGSMATYLEALGRVNRK
jgi:hypothetical protein